jgi:RNA polymerase-binding transcription factor DksA
MTRTELDHHRRQLLALRDRLTGDVSHLQGEALSAAGDEGGNLSHVPLHMADLGTDNYERENTLRLLANEERLLEQIDAALERIDRGTFGRCEECQGPILPRGRLDELPYTRHCVECAKKLDGRRS